MGACFGFGTRWSRISPITNIDVITRNDGRWLPAKKTVTAPKIHGPIVDEDLPQSA